MTHVNGRVECMTWDLGQMSGSGKCGVRKVIFIGIVAGHNLSEWCWLLFLYCFGKSFGKMANGKGRGRSGNIPCQMEKVAFQQTNRLWGGGDSICKALEELGRDIFYYLQCSQGGCSLSDLSVCWVCIIPMCWFKQRTQFKHGKSLCRPHFKSYAVLFLPCTLMLTNRS